MRWTQPRSRRARWRRRLAAALTLLAGYVGAYYHLSRASLRNNAVYGMEAILYVPYHDVFPADGNARTPTRWRAIQRHYALALLFAPVHWVDRLLFRTPPPESCFLMLSG